MWITVIPKKIAAQLICFIFGFLPLFILCQSAPVDSKRITVSGNDARLVQFVFRGRTARSVCVAGSFNGWSTTNHCLKKHGDTWTLEMFLAPGRYTYGFVIDGKRPVPDPRGILFEDSGFGTKNSILIVK